MSDVRNKGFDAIDEAAAQWVVRLADGRPGDALREGFEQWLARDSRHAPAFERIHGVWTGAGAAGQQLRSRRRTRVAGLVLAVALVALPLTLFLRDPVYQTGRGEQEVVALDDGTRLTLNTDSRVTVNYEQGVRRVALNRGEVYFDVARNPDRPFVVNIDRDNVRVLGTSFLIRRDGEETQVTLVSGSVLVNHGGADALTRPPLTLSPGERVRWRQGAPNRIDRPKLESSLAWRRGELVLEQTLVADAVAEMNRYSRTPMVLNDAQVARARISGVFKTGDSETFAHTLARLYGLQVQRRAGKIVMERRPA